MVYVANVAPTTQEPPSSVNSDLVYVVDQTNGFVLYERDPLSVTDWPASAIKVLSMLLIAELKSSVLTTETVTWQTSDDIDPSFSQVGFQDGDVITWQDIIYGALLVSGGDGVQAAARVLGNEALGQPLTSEAGYEQFALMLNARLRQLDTTGRVSVINGHGAGRQKMTARAIALAGAACFSNSDIAALATSTSFTIEVTGANARSIPLTTSNRVATDTNVSNVNGRSKTGSLTIPAIGLNTFTLTTLWGSPSGAEIAIGTLANSTSSSDRFTDTETIINQLPNDFPYLDTTPDPIAVEAALTTTISPANTTSMNVSYPQNINANDELYACIMSRSAVTPPAGWSLVATQSMVAGSITQNLQWFRTTATGSETGTVQFTQAVGNRFIGFIYRLRPGQAGATLVPTVVSTGSNLFSEAGTRLQVGSISATPSSGIILVGVSGNLANTLPNATTLEIQSPYQQGTPLIVQSNRMAAGFEAVAGGFTDTAVEIDTTLAESSNRRFNWLHLLVSQVV
ncbi:hypothetical protein P67b_00005 [Ruegeria phage Tedan]|nr:hypothetical protein P67b_00005 [Ruegeria phage Tedan]